MNEKIQGIQKKLDKISKTIENEEERKDFLKRMEGFVQLASISLSQPKGIDWEKAIKVPDSKMVKLVDVQKQFGNLKRSEIRSLLQKVFVLKLNGGMGTNMGVKGPKALVYVKKGTFKQTFLSIVCRQIMTINKEYDVDIPLVLMNSFYTHSDISEYLKSYKSKMRILIFQQKMYPKLLADQFLPMAKDSKNIKHYNPPGHGDVYDSLLSSDVYTKLIKEGREIMFLSNIDNLRSTIDIPLLKWIIDNKTGFAMEVTPKTPSDVKGESVVEIDNRLKIIEMYMVPKEREEELAPKLGVFNTNNMWVNIKKMKENISEIRKVNVIYNRKVVDGHKVIQLEQACAAAIRCFKKSTCVVVERTRFLPVKKNCDLLLIRSDLYKLDEESGFFSKEKEDENPPLIVLNGKKLNDISEFDKLIPEVPDISELKELHLTGDVYLGKGLKMSGVVKIDAGEKGGKIEIK